MENVMLILGNGFTIDFIDKIHKTEEIDVCNLFKNGDNVPWPENDRSGFLSYKYCPNLWNLGARPYLNTHEAITLIEDIITCANILEVGNRTDQNIYFKAYKELVHYLYSLFIYYDSKVDNKSIKNINSTWGWAKYFKKLSNDRNVKNVYIITFNYDIWLERILKLLNIDFEISCFESKNTKFQIFKPHGSISFQSKIKTDKDAFQIFYTKDNESIDVDKFDIKYTSIDALGAKKAIIPPAGDSARLNFDWAKSIRDNIKTKAQSLNEDDDLVICGVSYWHVDRLEIDSILKDIKPEIQNVRIINPNPPRVLNAVFTSLFKNVIFHTNCKNINK